MQCAVWGAVQNKCAVVEKGLGSTALASQSANVSKMPLCRLLYRSSAASELQLERTCLFV